MRIDNQSVGMYSKQYYTKVQEETNEVKAVSQSGTSGEQVSTAASPSPEDVGYVVEISEEGKEIQAAQQAQISEAVSPKEEKLKAQLVGKFFQELTGKNINFAIHKLANLYKHSLRQSEEEPDVSQDGTQDLISRQAISFSTEGIIKTADGKEVKFTAEFSMTKEFVQAEDLNPEEMTAAEPMELSFGGFASEIKNANFSFVFDFGEEGSIAFEYSRASSASVEIVSGNTASESTEPAEETDGAVETPVVADGQETATNPVTDVQHVDVLV